MGSRQQRFALDASCSPTYFNITKVLKRRGWRYTSVSPLAALHAGHFDFDANITQQLEFKHLLARWVARISPECMPLTYCLHEHNWLNVINLIRARQYSAAANQADAWILKPALLNNGQHIKIFEQLESIQRYYQNPKRLHGPYVLQHYLRQPDCLNGPKGLHKYSIRAFVLLTNYAGFYLYPQAYFNVAKTAYNPNQLDSHAAHITNEHLPGSCQTVVQIPAHRFAAFSGFYEQIKSICSRVLSPLPHYYSYAWTTANKPRLALFGFDFMVDSQQRVWLLEANHGPCFPTFQHHPLQEHLYDSFWQSFVDEFILPLAEKESICLTNPQQFERLCIINPSAD